MTDETTTETNGKKAPPMKSLEIFLQLKKILPDVKEDDYKKNGVWQDDVMRLDAELIRRHCRDAGAEPIEAKLPKYVPPPKETWSTLGKNLPLFVVKNAPSLVNNPNAQANASVAGQTPKDADPPGSESEGSPSKLAPPASKGVPQPILVRGIKRAADASPAANGSVKRPNLGIINPSVTRPPTVTRPGRPILVVGARSPSAGTVNPNVVRVQGSVARPPGGMIRPTGGMIRPTGGMTRPIVATPRGPLVRPMVNGVRPMGMVRPRGPVPLVQRPR